MDDGAEGGTIGVGHLPLHSLIRSFGYCKYSQRVNFYGQVTSKNHMYEKPGMGKFFIEILISATGFHETH